MLEFLNVYWGNYVNGSNSDTDGHILALFCSCNTIGNVLHVREGTEVAMVGGQWNHQAD